MVELGSSSDTLLTNMPTLSILIKYTTSELPYSCIHTTLIILLISFLSFFSSFSFIFVHLSLLFSLLFHFLALFFSQNSLFILKIFTQILFFFFSNFLSLSPQFFLCYVRVSSFAVWVWVWWVIGIVVM